MTLDEYFTHELAGEKTINIIVERFAPNLGSCAASLVGAQPIPAEVRTSNEGLVTLGFTQHLIAETPTSHPGHGLR